MAMQTLHQETDSSVSKATPTDHPVLQGLAADSATAYAQEVQVLRERVALLEAALASAEAVRDGAAIDGEAVPLTSIDFAAPGQPKPFVESEFSAQLTPAVVAVSPAPTSNPAPTEQPEALPPSDVRFAQAWTEGDVTFEERVAERAFFQASTIDEQSRNWLLDDK